MQEQIGLENVGPSLVQVIKQKRETFRINIRKEGLENKFKQKRQQYLAELKEMDLCKQSDEKENFRTFCIEDLRSQMTKLYKDLTDLFYEKNYNMLAIKLKELRDYLFENDGHIRIKLISLYEIRVNDLIFTIFQACNQQNLAELEINFIIIQCFQNIYSLEIFDDKEFLQNQSMMEKVLTLLHFQDHQADIFFLFSNLLAFVSNGDEVKGKIILDIGLVSIIIEMWEQRTISRDRKTIENLMWFFSNLTMIDNKYRIPKIFVEKIISIVCDCFKNFKERKIQYYCLDIMTNAIQFNKNIITFLLSIDGVIQGIFQLCDENALEYRAIQTIANLAGGKDRDTNILIKAGVIDLLERKYIHAPTQNIRLIIWALANIHSLDDIEIQQQIINNNLLKRLLKDARSFQDIALLIELSFLLKNLCLIKDILCLKSLLFTDQFIEIIIFMISEFDNETLVSNCFDAIHHIANFFKKVEIQTGVEANLAIEFFNQCGLEQALNMLQNSRNQKIAQTAIRIYELYYL